MPHLLFVCTGNICRSPFAERYAASLVARGGWPAGWTFASAGTGAVVGHGIEDDLATELVGRGCDPDGFAARQVDLAILGGADWVVTMTTRHRRWLLDQWPERFRTIFSLGQLVTALDRVDPSVRGEAALRAAAALRVPALESGDVPDPYGRGEPAALAAAVRISADLDRLASRLL